MTTARDRFTPASVITPCPRAPACGGFALGPASYTDTTINVTVTIKAAHVTELRNALDAARAALGLPISTYTDQSLASGAIIKAAHFQ